MPRNESENGLRQELDGFVSSGGKPATVRNDIAASWERSVHAGLRPDRFDVPYVEEIDDDGRLMWAARPVIDRVAEDLDGSGIALILTDGRGHVLDRRTHERGIARLLDGIELAPGFVYDEHEVGTNAIGTALAQEASSVVAGSEHFADALIRMACAATPITDAQGQVLGVLDLTCASDTFSPLMLSIAKGAAREIGERLEIGTPAKFGVERALLADLAASRARVLAAADEARRRIERDLHDGIQQQLVSLGLGLNDVQASVPPGAEQMKDKLSRLAGALWDTLDDLREISRGIHPAILSEGGLGVALRTLVRRSPIPVELEERIEGRFARALEIGAYYVASESLANVTKHAKATRAKVSLELHGDVLTLTVTDDGIGGADAGGSGLIGLKERIETLGGTFRLVSPRGSGTLVHVELPLS